MSESLESKIIANLTKSDLSIQSQFHSGYSLDVRRLDWGATSLPLEHVENAVKDQLWKKYGNPHSCGTITGTLTKNILEEARDTVLLTLLGDRFVDKKFLAEFGGEGSTYWLEKIPGIFDQTTHEVVCLQKEVHNSLVEPWIENSWKIHSPPTSNDVWSWFSRRLRYIREIEGKTPIVLLSLSSHISGGVLDLKRVKDHVREGDVIVLDATCYLTHHPSIPDIEFDFAVFSGHKLPGGPGSPGCILFNRRYSVNLSRRRGTENVPGIVRLTHALELNVQLLKKKNPRPLKMLNSLLRVVHSSSCSLVPIFWDPEEIYEPVREPIYSFIVRYGEKMIHPDIIADIFLHVFGMQIRVGGLCSDYAIPHQDYLNIGPEEWTETRSMELIFKPSVCRISIPEYLLNDNLVLDLETAFQEFTFYGHMFVSAYTCKPDGWDLHPNLIQLLQNTVTEKSEIKSGKSCKKCPGVKKNPVVNEEKKEETDPEKITHSAIIASIIASDLQHTSDDEILKHPYRWFLHPGDDIATTDEF